MFIIVEKTHKKRKHFENHHIRQLFEKKFKTKTFRNLNKLKNFEKFKKISRQHNLINVYKTRIVYMHCVDENF